MSERHQSLAPRGDFPLLAANPSLHYLDSVATAWGTEHVSRGDEIIVTGLEHHANFVPWQQLARERGARLAICSLTSDGQLDLECLASLITPRTRVVAFNHVSNALGTINPV